MGSRRVPLAAATLLIIMGCVGLLVGLVIGSWILPVIIGLAHGGWSEIGRIPVSERIFGSPPAFIAPESTVHTVTEFAVFVLAIPTGLLGLWLTQIWWRHLVVKKWKWMTDQEVKEYLQRAGKYG
jgi:hypothetical protein